MTTSEHLRFASETARKAPRMNVGWRVQTPFGTGTIVETIEYKNAPGHWTHVVAIGNSTRIVSDVRIAELNPELV